MNVSNFFKALFSWIFSSLMWYTRSEVSLAERRALEKGSTEILPPWELENGTGWQWQPTPVLLPGKSHGQRTLVGCSPWGRTESDMTERLPFHFSLSCIGEGNGNPLQCSCLENPRDVGAWWAAVYGVAQSWTRLKRLSSSGSTVEKNQPAISGVYCLGVIQTEVNSLT